MTVAATAAETWADLAAGNVHAMQAIDRVMECGLEREAAVKALHEAAADWMHEMNSGVDWNRTPDAVEGRIREGSFEFFDCTEFIDPVGTIREWTFRDESRGRWFAWCNRADQAIAILRELKAYP
jgi:hypothetical protein